MPLTAHSTNINLCRVILLLSLVCCATIAMANDGEAITKVVNRWNELHQQKNGQAFKEVLAPDIFFFGRTVSRQQCCNAKAKLLKMGFAQTMTSSLDIHYYQSGTVKCNFTKNTIAANTTRSYNCYLLLKKFANGYLITGEGDPDMDALNSIALDLGPEENNAFASIFVTVALLVVGAVGYFYNLRHRRTRRQKKVSEKEPLSIPPITATAKELPMNTSDELSKAKGNDFENYISQKFEKKFFRLLEWRGDKMYNGVYALSSHHPDMEWELVHKKSCFAVECKYRSTFINGAVTIAKEYQLKNYLEFAKNSNRPVFIVLGLGGSAAAPARIFIIPIKEICSNVIFADQLKRFEKLNPTDTFNYNWQNLQLS